MWAQLSDITNATRTAGRLSWPHVLLGLAFRPLHCGRKSGQAFRHILSAHQGRVFGLLRQGRRSAPIIPVCQGRYCSPVSIYDVTVALLSLKRYFSVIYRRLLKASDAKQQWRCDSLSLTRFSSFNLLLGDCLNSVPVASRGSVGITGLLRAGEFVHQKSFERSSSIACVGPSKFVLVRCDDVC